MTLSEFRHTFEMINLYELHAFIFYLTYGVVISIQKVNSL